MADIVMMLLPPRCSWLLRCFKGHEHAHMHTACHVPRMQRATCTQARAESMHGWLPHFSPGGGHWWPLCCQLGLGPHKGGLAMPCSVLSCTP
jgi:hypothetical protein